MIIKAELVATLLTGSTAVVRAEGSYDMLFRTGTLDSLEAGAMLEYEQSGSSLEEADPGMQDIDLRVTVGNEAETYLDLVSAEASRRIGVFPTDVGNPLLMYALETVVRDLSELTGGSPFYIRNRLKDAIATETAAEEVSVPFDGSQIAASRVTLYPFRDDPGADRFPGLGELEVAVAVSQSVPGWYHSISTRIPTEDGYDYSITIAGGDVQ